MSGWITRNRWWVKHTTKQPGINWSYPTLWPIVLISLLLHAAPCMFNVHNVCSFRISDKTLSQKIFRDSFPRIGHEVTSLCTRCWRENRALRLKLQKQGNIVIDLAFIEVQPHLALIHPHEREIAATWLITVTPVITSTVGSHSS